MAERERDDLYEFLLSDVHLTGTRIGVGSYGSVEEVSIPVKAAAKRIHSHLQHDDDLVAQFKKECRMMSNIRHPNIVQFLGVCNLPDSRLPALVMERMLTNLHSLLQPEPPSPPSHPHASLKFSILCDVASGLAYLHGQSPPIIHGDLSARNVLLNSAMVAKISDLGMARTNTPSRLRPSAGTSVYMPPDAEEDITSSVDVFSFGVIAIFTFGEVFPGELEPATYYDYMRESIMPRTEVERRSKYMKIANRKLGFRWGFIAALIKQCLHNSSLMRPSICEVLQQLEEARGSKSNKRELVQTNQVRDWTC